MMDERILQRDLALFADLGTDPPRMMPRHNGRLVARMFRGGEELQLEFHANGSGKVLERPLGGGEPRTHASYKALLASERFGNLRQWADSQRTLFKGMYEGQPSGLRVSGALDRHEEDVGPEEMNNFLAGLRTGPDRVEVLLIDGPAGIGKTRFIESLAALRATDYVMHQRPLLLHVESRGRVLTFIQDLIAFSLQRMRVPVTFDQVPVLVRNGLIVLAIDGFDELGDPSGYDYAWGQLNELIREVRGGGVVILAGRDTFIGPERIRRDIQSLTCQDGVSALTLQPPTPQAAQAWLRNHGWQHDDLASVSELFELDSYALRPFFLAQLAVPEIANIIKHETAGAPLAFLVELMINREIGKFGSAVDAVMDAAQRHGFVTHFLREVARFMADDQTESVDEVALVWMVEIALDQAAPDLVKSDVKGVLQNRALVMAFLVKDSAQNHRRFAHSQLFNHFLGEETLDTIARNEMPKYLRRNILGADFLAAFGDLVAHVARGGDAQRLPDFHVAAKELVRTHTSVDRGPRNLGALLITMLPAMPDDGRGLALGPLDVDEALMTNSTAPRASLNRVVVSQLDLRGADVRALTFIDSVVVTLIADDATRLCRDFPIPSQIRHETGGIQRTVFEPNEIRTWIAEGAAEPVPSMGAYHSGYLSRNHPLRKLLERVCRNRSYWIRLDASDEFSARLVEDPVWYTLVGLLRQHDLVRVEQRPAGGQRSEFLHIKKPMKILRKLSDDEQIDAFHRSLDEAIEASSHQS